MATTTTSALTVHILDAQGDELRVFRVPVAASTTVKDLAYEALTRFVRQTRFTTQNTVEVYDVTVNGCSLFFRDPISSVVGPTEHVCLRINGVTAADVAPRRIAVQPASNEVSPIEAIPTAATAPAPLAAPAPAAVSSSAPAAPAAEGRRTAPAVVAAPKAPASSSAAVDLKRSRKEETEEHQPEFQEPAPRRAPRAEPAVVDPVLAEARSGELGWGEKSAALFDPNYVSDPDKLARMLRKQNAALKKAEKAKAQQATAAAAEAAVTSGDVQIVERPQQQQQQQQPAVATEDEPAGRATTSAIIAPADPAADVAPKQPQAVASTTTAALAAKPAVSQRAVARMLDFA